MNDKVLITASTFGHIASFHTPYLKALKERGFEIHIACGGAVIDFEDADRIIPLPLEKKYCSLSNLKAVGMLRTNICENGYSLIITHTTLASVATRLALMFIKKRPKTVNVVHGYLFDEHTGKIKNIFLKTAELMLKKQTDKTLTMNDFDYAWAKKNKVSPYLCKISGMGVDTERIHPVNKIKKENSDYVFVYPAEFTKRKNHMILICAMELLPDNIKLILPGEGELRDKCIALTKKKGLEKRISFPGYVNDINEIYSFADAAVTTSLCEGMPFNVIEAMLCGLPVVANEIKGHTDLIENGVNGLLYEYNSLPSLAEKMNTLASDREKAAQMGLTGRQKAQKYTLAAVMDVNLNEYCS